MYAEARRGLDHAPSRLRAVRAALVETGQAYCHPVQSKALSCANVNLEDLSMQGGKRGSYIPVLAFAYCA